MPRRDSDIRRDPAWNTTGPIISFPFARLFKIVAHQRLAKARDVYPHCNARLLLMDHV